MSDTPETDAHSPHRYSITTPDGVTTHFVPADFARKLERERNSYKEMWESWRSENRCNLAAVSLLKDERDQLVEKLSEARRKLKEARDTARWLYQRGMATLIEGASRNEWIKEEIK